MTNQYEPFDNAEEVWFWFCACVVTRADGLRGRGDYSGKKRECELADILSIIRNIKRYSTVSNRHLRVLYKWGELMTPPYYDRRAKSSEIRLWEEAMKVFESFLIQKGILK